MLTTANDIRRTFVILAVLALALIVLPIPDAHALAPSALPTPAAPSDFRAQRLERAWLRGQIGHDRLGVMFDHVDQRLALAQQRIDQAQANGKDVSALQTALNNFSAAVKQARPTFDGMQGIIASHAGFDASGNVTDLTQATATVTQLREQFVQIRSVLAGPGQALKSAVRAFRTANPRP